MVILTTKNSESLSVCGEGHIAAGWGIGGLPSCRLRGPKSVHSGNGLPDRVAY